MRLRDISFCALTREYLPTVYEWRRSNFVSQFMLTDVSDKYSNHVQWFDEVASSSTCIYWVIKLGQVPVGIANLAEINWDKLECSAGYYIGDKNYTALGALPLPYLYNYVFICLGFKRLFGQVREENYNIRRIHKMHGYRESAPYTCDGLRGSQEIRVISVELLARDWLSKKQYSKSITHFEV